MARLETEEREMAYRFYITDAMYLSGHNQTWSVRFSDILDGKVKAPEDVDGDEIAREVIANAGLICKE